MKKETDFTSKSEYHAYLRIYFAGMAMEGMIQSFMNERVKASELDEAPNICAQWSVKFADALLKQLEQS